MTKDFFADGVLVYDRYYCSKPNTPLLMIKHILLVALFCTSSMMYILTQYRFPVSLPAMAAVCVCSCAVFCTLFTFVKKRFALPALLAISGLLLWHCWKYIEFRLSYFADACMLLVEGRFLYPRGYLFNNPDLLTADNPYYVRGVAFGTVLLCILYSMIISACFSGRLLPIPAILFFIALCAPVMLSESLEFSLWLIPAMASFAAFCAIRKNYSGGLAVRHSNSGDYRRRLRSEERSFLKHISSAPYGKRVEMRCNYYSKYFSAGMYCAALASVCLLVGTAIFPEGGSIDYTAAYDFIVSLGNTGIDSPFDSGTASDYFSQNENEHDLLNVISPGRGDREMLRVTYTGSRPVYLRGDFGIDFRGTSWTTAVGAEPKLWKNSPLKQNYRPCENMVIQSMMNASSVVNSDVTSIVTTSDISIEYLCSTNVVFLPPYTADFSYFDSELFDVYSDYAVRVSDEGGSQINSVECTALVPSYTSNESLGDNLDDLDLVDMMFELHGCTPDEVYSAVVPEMTESGVLSDYEKYVYQVYCSIPDRYRNAIGEYLDSNADLNDSLRSLRALYNDGSYKTHMYYYSAAALVADYLRSNYTYSLDGINNSPEPVLQFLNDTKRGHCSLYASAMTLILRQQGIPARYCTGFYVDGKGENTVMLREKNLHAWVEVYAGQYGWVTFDPTSSSAYPDDIQPEPSVSTAESQPEITTVSEATTAQTTATSTSQPDATSDSSEETEAAPLPTDESSIPQGGNAELVIVIIAAALVVLGSVGVVVYQSNFIKKRALEALNTLRGGDSTECARCIYSLLIRLAELRGISTKAGELPQGFFSRVDAEFGASLAEHTQLLERMEFGSGDVSDEERMLLHSQLTSAVDKLKAFRLLGNAKVLKILINGTKNIKIV